jgi:type I restriction enzyme, S subunit
LEKNDLPESWEFVSLSTIATINPKKPSQDELSDDTLVSFVPMKSVEELSGKINLNETRKCGEVRKGYTYFQNDDILFAKITPCMENGKITIADKLENSIGFGSTEFHVIRLKDKINPKFYFHYLIQDDFRNKAKSKMKGTAGQLRVSSNYLKEGFIPLPPLNEQKRIVDEIEKRKSKLDNIKTILENINLNLIHYRQSLLKSLFENQNWRYVKLGDFLTLEYGKALSKKDRKKGNIPVLGSSGIGGYHNEALVKSSSLVIGRKGNAGNILFVEQPFWAIDTTYYLKETKYYDLKFLYHLFKFLNFKKLDSSTAIPSLRRDDVYAQNIPLPEMNEQNEIVSQIEQRFTLIKNIENITGSISKQLDVLLSTILKQAFEGKLVPQDPNDEPVNKLLNRLRIQN